MSLCDVILVLACATAACGIYIDDTYPYLPGSLPTTSKLFNFTGGPPVATTVYYPDTVGGPDNYAMSIFIGGFSGWIPPGFYADILEPLASHGYITAAPWTLGSDVDEFIEIVVWLVNNLESEIGVRPSWINLSMGCHSAGCDNILDLIRAYPYSNHTFKAINFLEPSSFNVNVIPLPYTVPGYFLGAQLAEGFCIQDGFDYKAFYDAWECPRILMDALNFGHCDLLTTEAWLVCDATNFCPVGPADQLPAYKDFVQGAMASMLNTYVQGSPQYLDYLVDPTKIPIALDEFEYDVDC